VAAVLFGKAAPHPIFTELADDHVGTAPEAGHLIPRENPSPPAIGVSKILEQKRHPFNN
jgi:hypothetical protein